MPRCARVVAVGLPHHITQRGNYGQDVFFDTESRNLYLGWIQEYSTKHSLSILIYCLMQNHVHFIAIPDQPDSLSKTFNSAHMRYSQHVNKKFKRRGHLWQGRFYSSVLDEPHLILAARYIERNPVRAGLVEKPWEWPWSSAIAHTNEDINPDIALRDFLGLTGMSHDSWKEYVDLAEKKSFLECIRKSTHSGLPLGTTEFIEMLETKFGRRLSQIPMGRPKHKQDS